jgi:hypothetical protein
MAAAFHDATVLDEMFPDQVPQKRTQDTGFVNEQWW